MLQQEGDSFWLCCVLMWTLKAPQVHAEFSFSSPSWMFELWSDVCAELHTKTLFFHIYCSKCTFSPSWLKRACRHDLCSPASLWTCQTQQPAQKARGKVCLVLLQCQFLQRCWFSPYGWGGALQSGAGADELLMHFLSENQLMLLSKQWFIFNLCNVSKRTCMNQVGDIIQLWGNSANHRKMLS